MGRMPRSGAFHISSIAYYCFASDAFIFSCHLLSAFAMVRKAGHAGLPRARLRPRDINSPFPRFLFFFFELETRFETMYVHCLGFLFPCICMKPIFLCNWQTHEAVAALVQSFFFFRGESEKSVAMLSILVDKCATLAVWLLLSLAVAALFSPSFFALSNGRRLTPFGKCCAYRQ